MNIQSKVNEIFNHYIYNEQPIDVKVGELVYENGISICWSNLDKRNEQNDYVPIVPFGKSSYWILNTWDIVFKNSDEEFLQFVLKTPLRTYPVNIKFTRKEMAELKTKLEIIFEEFENNYILKIGEKILEQELEQY